MSFNGPLTAVCAAAALSLTAGLAFAATQPARLTVTNQKVIGSEVSIADAQLPADGFLAIHASDTNGAITDRTLGYVALKAGDHKAVKVRLSSAPKAGEKLWAVLHGDTGTKGTFEFGQTGKTNVDMPLMEGSKAVEMPFTIQ